jgi:carbonic anhydrase
MKESFAKIIDGYKEFRAQYVTGTAPIMQSLSVNGQQPQTMVVACCDSRVDPALILQCDPGDLFVVRNVANIVPPYEKDDLHHGTSAALEFGVCFLKVKHLILLGHSQCGGIKAFINSQHYCHIIKDDFITNWVSIIQAPQQPIVDVDECAKMALKQSQQNCLAFPWIADKVNNQTLVIHLWFFDIETGKIFTYSAENDSYQPLL